MAVCDFGLSPDDAWRLTLPEINHLANYAETRERAKYYRAAMVVSAIYNVNMDTKKRKKPFTPEEILGEKKGGDMIETVKMLTALHGGTVSDEVNI